MNLHPFFWPSGGSWLAVVAIVLSGSQAAAPQSATNELLKIAELRSMSYQRTGQPNIAQAISYQDLENTIRLAGAYSRGKQLLPSYQEPILTRGTSGITVFRNASPGVVLVIVGDVKNQQFDPSGLGAGVILDTSGNILTNWHVIAGHSGAVIFFKPESSADINKSPAYVARVVAQNEVSDLALLRLIKSPANLAPISLGNISAVQVAEDIHVIGHPNGNLWSYSTGVVSQIRNAYSWSYSDGSKHEAKVLQLQTAINPGNSGGPVLDDQGKLLGLIAMSEEGQNLDYAVAADVIKSFVLSSASMQTRGGGSEESSQSAEYSWGELGNGERVLRTVFPNLTEYVVIDGKAKIIELAAETSDGVNLLAWEPNSFAGFSEWSIALPQGLVHASGNAALPDQFSSQ